MALHGCGLKELFLYTLSVQPIVTWVLVGALMVPHIVLRFMPKATVISICYKCKTHFYYQDTWTYLILLIWWITVGGSKHVDLKIPMWFIQKTLVYNHESQKPTFRYYSSTLGYLSNHLQILCHGFLFYYVILCFQFNYEFHDCSHKCNNLTLNHNICGPMHPMFSEAPKVTLLLVKLEILASTN